MIDLFCRTLPSMMDNTKYLWMEMVEDLGFGLSVTPIAFHYDKIQLYRFS